MRGALRLINADMPEEDEAEPAAVIGIDIGGTNYTAALVAPNGEPLEVLRGKTDPEGGPQALIGSLSAMVPELMAEARERRLSVSGIGIGFGGPIDFLNGMVRLSHHVEGWEGFPLRQEMARLSHLPVIMDNDANAAALGEHRFGVGRGLQDLVYYNIGTGIGGAIILGGQIRRGPSNLAGELGHTTVQPGGPVCTCGQQGCLEALASGRAISRRIAELQIPWQNRMAVGEDFFDLVDAGNEPAATVLDEVVSALAFSIRNVIHTLNPEMIVIGGGVSRGGKTLLGPLRERVSEICFPEAYRDSRIVHAQLGYDAGVIGAASLALEVVRS
ncbi:MAG: ROK family protein [Armatimonadota bacterium]|nr:ROK family protein [Armatimonadota bacterium]